MSVYSAKASRLIFNNNTKKGRNSNEIFEKMMIWWLVVMWYIICLLFHNKKGSLFRSGNTSSQRARNHLLSYTDAHIWIWIELSRSSLARRNADAKTHLKEQIAQASSACDLFWPIRSISEKSVFPTGLSFQSIKQISLFHSLIFE